jgi:transcriptional regulator with PAS, ATPase and Fis domain
MVYEIVGQIYHGTGNEDRLLRWFRSVFNSIQVGVLVVDAKTKIVVDINNAAALMIGSKREDIVGNSCVSCCCLSISNKCPVIDLGIDIEDELCTLVRKDGSKINILVTITSAFRNNRRFLIRSFVDIGSCKEDEKDWAEAEQLLRDNIFKMKKVCNNVKDADKVKYRALSYGGKK